jgi:hypothetical protein
MKNIFLKTISTAALAFLMIATFAQISALGQDTNIEENSSEQKLEDSLARRENTRKLEGVWNVQVTRLDCVTGATLGTGPAILTFVRGGTMHDFGTGRPPATRSAGYGVWSYHTNRRYSDAFQFFIYNADGTLAGKQIVREQIVLSRDGNSFTNSAASQILDVSGNVTANRCSTAVGTRFE